MDPMRTGTSSGSGVRLLAALGIAAALAAATGPLPAVAGGTTGAAPAGEGLSAGDAASCRLCHADPRYGKEFGHRALEDAGTGCASCHDGGAAHVAAGGKGAKMSLPTRLSPEAERALCLRCHEAAAFASPGHLAPRGESARCADCHVLHGHEKPVRAVRGLDLRPAAGDVTAPAGPKPFFGGRAEAGWRFVGGEEGRYDQDVNLGEGPRLFALSLRGGTNESDPRAPRYEASLDGLGDSGEQVRLEAWAGDRWRASVSARRDELPFLGGGGLHGGETERERLGASLDLRLSESARLGAGFDVLRTVGEVRGTLFESGSVIPVAGEADRTAREAWLSLALRRKTWHASLRQGFRSEDGDERRDRERSLPGVRDFLAYDDDSTLRGPVTAVIFGMDLLDDRLSLEIRGSRSSLDRTVSTSETRLGTVGALPFTRRARTTGDRDRIVLGSALDASFLLDGSWALEGSFDRRTLDEDGDLDTVEMLDTGTGPTTTSSSTGDGITQRLLRESLGVRFTPARATVLRAGAEFRSDTLDLGPGSDTVRSRGWYLGAETRPSDEFTLFGKFRTTRTRGAFTPLTAEDDERWEFGARFRDDAGHRAEIRWRRTDLFENGSGYGARGDELRTSVGGDPVEAVTANLGFTLRDLEREVDATAFVGGSPTPREVRSRLHSYDIDFTIGVDLADRWKAWAATAWVLDEGDYPVRAIDTTVGIGYRINDRFAARITWRRREYDEMGLDAADYSASILEAAVEVKF